jgi:hypothetical protein
MKKFILGIQGHSDKIIIYWWSLTINFQHFESINKSRYKILAVKFKVILNFQNM